ncbi:MAG: SIS domain-containing protein [Candidatus Omnitrophota bacterium]|nr:SIS domain-containing protein [Candidatus Omnitrophota bacterium]
MFKYFEDLSKLCDGIQAQGQDGKNIDIKTAFNLSISAVKKASKSGKKIIFIGNGGSASIASHMAIDFWKNGRMKAVSFNDPAQLTCLANDYGYEYVFEKPIEFFGEEGDVLVAISSSGKSENIIKGVKAALAKKIQVITMSGFTKDNLLRKMGSLNFFVPSDSYGFVEIIHGAICHCVLDTILCE